MFQFLLAMLLGFMSPSNTTTTNNNDPMVSTTGTGAPADDTGGETGHTPPRKP